MAFVVFISVLISVYVIKNEKVKESSRIGWFVVIILVFVLTTLLSLI